MWWMLREGWEGRRFRHWKRWRCSSGIWTTWATFSDPLKTSFRWSILLASRLAVFLFKVFWGKLYYSDLCKSSALYSLWRVYTSLTDIQLGHGTCGSPACRKTYFCFSLASCRHQALSCDSFLPTECKQKQNRSLPSSSFQSHRRMCPALLFSFCHEIYTAQWVAAPSVWVLV